MISLRLQLLWTIALLATATACRPTPPQAAAVETDEVANEDASRPPRVILGDSAIRLAGIVIDSARPARDFPDAVALAVPGEVAADPARIALITPRTTGRLERLLVAVGEQVASGQVVAEILSPVLLMAETDHQLARKRAERLSGTPDSAGAWALVESSARRLRLLGVTDRELARLANGGEPTSILPLTAPFRGSLVEAGALPGSRVEPGTPVFRLIDLREVDVIARVAETEIATLRVGQPARMVLDAFPDRRVGGVVERIRDELDPTTRTIEAVLHVENPGGWLRPGMFGTVYLQGAGVRPTDVLVPESALVTEGDGQALFVAVDPQTFERRAVTTVPLPPVPGALHRRVIVRTGLRAGERIVVQGAFVLKSELGKAAFAEEE